METWKKEKNQEWLDQLKSLLSEGGKWVWKDTGHIYTLTNGELVGDTEEADVALQEILPE